MVTTISEPPTSARTAIQSVATPAMARTTAISLIAIAAAVLARTVASVARPRRIAEGDAAQVLGHQRDVRGLHRPSGPRGAHGDADCGRGQRGRVLTPSPTIATGPMRAAKIVHRQLLSGSSSAATCRRRCRARRVGRPGVIAGQHRRGGRRRRAARRSRPAAGVFSRSPAPPRPIACASRATRTTAFRRPPAAACASSAPGASRAARGARASRAAGDAADRAATPRPGIAWHRLARARPSGARAHARPGAVERMPRARRHGGRRRQHVARGDAVEGSDVDDSGAARA